MANGTYVKPKPIGSAVVTTDDFILKGYDFVPLYMGGMLKVDPTATGMTVAEGDNYAKPTGGEKLLKPTDAVPANP